MKEKVSFKEKFNNWYVPRKKTLIKLGFWLLYITLVVIFVRSLISNQNENNVTNLSKVEQLKTMNNYSFECYYNDVFYTGVKKDNIEEITIEDKKYYYDGTWYEIKDEEKIEIDEVVKRLTPEQIYTILESGNYTKTEKVDEFDELTFTVSLSKLGYDSDKTIEVYVYLIDDEIKGVTILGQACAYNKIEE